MFVIIYINVMNVWCYTWKKHIQHYYGIAYL